MHDYRYFVFLLDGRLGIYMWGIWMVKKLTSVYIDDDIIRDAKKHGVNIGYCARIAVEYAVKKAKEYETEIKEVI